LVVVPINVGLASEYPAQAPNSLAPDVSGLSSCAFTEITAVKAVIIIQECHIVSIRI
jgi:hypothetical protein